MTRSAANTKSLTTIAPKKAMVRSPKEPITLLGDARQIL